MINPRTARRNRSVAEWLASICCARIRQAVGRRASLFDCVNAWGVSAGSLRLSLSLLRAPRCRVTRAQATE
eukprot:5890566-Pleurochrysis_carterae.AAC.1